MPIPTLFQVVWRGLLISCSANRVSSAEVLAGHPSDSLASQKTLSSPLRITAWLCHWKRSSFHLAEAHVGRRGFVGLGGRCRSAAKGTRLRSLPLCQPPSGKTFPIPAGLPPLSPEGEICQVSKANLEGGLLASRWGGDDGPQEGGRLWEMDATIKAPRRPREGQHLQLRGLPACSPQL